MEYPFMQMPDPDQRVIERRAEIIKAMRTIVPGEGVIADEAMLKAFECDGLMAYRQLPLIVVLPETTAQVSQILAYCHLNDVKIVPRGAGTGLSGGALPLADAITCTSRWPAAPPRVWGRGASSECSLLGRGAREG